ncbi:MAG: cupredoxin domain-containing protein [Gaiellaceae bacterium]
MLLGLSTGHQVGLAVTAGAFIVFALASSFLFPRFRPQFPGNGLLAFIVVCFVFFFGMLTAVEVFGAEESEGGGEAVAETSTGGEEPTTVQRTSTEQQTTTQRQTTTAPPKTTTVEAQDVTVTETEFKIAMPAKLAAGKYTFEVENEGKLPHDLAIKGGKKTELIDADGKAQLVVDLKPGKYHFYCSVPGHEQAGMKVDVTVS